MKPWLLLLLCGITITMVVSAAEGENIYCWKCMQIQSVGHGGFRKLRIFFNVINFEGSYGHLNSVHSLTIHTFMQIATFISCFQRNGKYQRLSEELRLGKIVGISAITLRPVISSTLRFVQNNSERFIWFFFLNMKLVSPIIEEEDLYHLEKGLHNTSEIGQWFQTLWDTRYWNQLSLINLFVVWYFPIVYLA